MSGFSRTDIEYVKYVSILAVALLSTVAVTAQRGEPQRARSASFDVVVGQRFGPIRETTSRAELETFFGASALRDTDVHIGEGLCTRGTRVLEKTPDEIDVAWQDAARTRVAFVRAGRPGGRWVTRRGVRVGMRLPELERLAGSVLTFSGFGWDYGGGLSWSEEGAGLGLRVTLDPEDNQIAHTLPGSDSIYGDRPVRSDHPLIRRLRVSVDEMMQSWGTHAGEYDCG